MTADHSNSPIHRYFAGLAENTFQTQLGIVDPGLFVPIRCTGFAVSRDGR